jgi:hypothetical protein
MISSVDLFRTGLLALLVGVAIPLAMQRLDRALKDFGELVAEAKRASVPAPSLTSQLVAAVPAVVAAARAFHDRSEP